MYVIDMLFGSVTWRHLEWELEPSLGYLTFIWAWELWSLAWTTEFGVCRVDDCCVVASIPVCCHGHLPRPELNDMSKFNIAAGTLSR